MKRLIYLFVVAVLTAMLTGCDDDQEKALEPGVLDDIDLTDTYDLYYNPSVMGLSVGKDSYYSGVDKLPIGVILSPNATVRWKVPKHTQQTSETFEPINLMAVTRERYALKECVSKKTKFKNLHEWENCDSAKVFGKIIPMQDVTNAPLYEFEVTDDLNGEYSADGVTITWNNEYIEVSTDRNFVPKDKYWNLYIRSGLFLSVFPIFFTTEGLYDFEYTYAYHIREIEKSKK